MRDLITYPKNKIEASRILRSLDLRWFRTLKESDSLMKTRNLEEIREVIRFLYKKSKSNLESSLSSDLDASILRSSTKMMRSRNISRR